MAPSARLRQWYGHDPARYEEFARRYRREIASGEQATALTQLRQLAGAGPPHCVSACRILLQLSMTAGSICQDHQLLSTLRLDPRALARAACLSLRRIERRLTSRTIALARPYLSAGLRLWLLWTLVAHRPSQVSQVARHANP